MWTCSSLRFSMFAPPWNRAGSGAGAAGPVKAANARRRDHHVGRAIVARQIGAQPRGIERPHRLGRAEDRAADRLAGKGGGLQVVEHELVGRVLGGADLLDDDVLLADELGRIE